MSFYFPFTRGRNLWFVVRFLHYLTSNEDSIYDPTKLINICCDASRQQKPPTCLHLLSFSFYLITSCVVERRFVESIRSHIQVKGGERFHRSLFTILPYFETKLCQNEIYRQIFGTFGRQMLSGMKNEPSPLYSLLSLSSKEFIAHHKNISHKYRFQMNCLCILFGINILTTMYFLQSIYRNTYFDNTANENSVHIHRLA